MKVTDKQYYMEDKLIGKLDLMCERSMGQNKFDNLAIIDGDEGYGKTNMMTACGYYVASKLNRKFDISNIFFDIDEMIRFAVNSSEQVIGWDEACLGGLSTEGYNKFQIKLIKLLMIARKKKHFYIFNIPKFYRLKEYIVDRAICLIHVYARKEVQLGRFVYYNKKAKEELYYAYRSNKKKMYKKFYTFRGTFPYVLPLLIDEKEYERKKDAAIAGLDKIESKDKDEIHLLKYKMSQLKYPINSREEMAKQMGVTYSIFTAWAERYSKSIKNEDTPDFDTLQNTNI